MTRPEADAVARAIWQKALDVVRWKFSSFPDYESDDLKDDLRALVDVLTGEQTVEDRTAYQKGHDAAMDEVRAVVQYL